MDKIPTEQIKKLRDKTGVSIMQCRKALEDSKGDMEKAIVLLRRKSAEAADKKNDRKLNAGAVASYIHGKGSVGSMVELFSETDFVSNNAEFQALAKDIAMHITAANPQYVSWSDISEDVKKKTEDAFMSEVKGKLENIQKKIIEGKLKSYFSERILMEQPFVKNQEIIVKDLIQSAVQKFGERIEIGRIARFSIRN